MRHGIAAVFKSFLENLFFIHRRQVQRLAPRRAAVKCSVEHDGATKVSDEKLTFELLRVQNGMINRRWFTHYTRHW